MIRLSWCPQVVHHGQFGQTSQRPGLTRAAAMLWALCDWPELEVGGWFWSIQSRHVLMIGPDIACCQQSHWLSFGKHLLRYFCITSRRPQSDHVAWVACNSRYFVDGWFQFYWTQIDLPWASVPVRSSAIRSQQSDLMKLWFSPVTLFFYRKSLLHKQAIINHCSNSCNQEMTWPITGHDMAEISRSTRQLQSVWSNRKVYWWFTPILDG